MASLGLNLKVTSKLNEISNELNKKTRRKLRNNIGELRAIVANAINKAVDKNRDQFIPTDQEAAELGVGSNGTIDTDKTNAAWLELRTAGEALQFSIQQTETGANGRIFGLLQVVIGEELFFNLPVSNISIEPSEDPSVELRNNIPWMKWLIEGAPTNVDYRFTREGRAISRTGEGLMVKGGVWEFRPARPDAFNVLTQAIEISIRRDIKRSAGRVL